MPHPKNHENVKIEELFHDLTTVNLFTPYECLFTSNHLNFRKCILHWLSNCIRIVVVEYINYLVIFYDS